MKTPCFDYASADKQESHWQCIRASEKHKLFAHKITGIKMATISKYSNGKQKFFPYHVIFMLLQAWWWCYGGFELLTKYKLNMLFTKNVCLRNFLTYYIRIIFVVDNFSWLCLTWRKGQARLANRKCCYVVWMIECHPAKVSILSAFLFWLHFYPSHTVNVQAASQKVARTFCKWKK